MKTFLLLLGAASMTGGQTVQPADTCPAPAAASSSHTRFDPIMVDLKGDGVAKVASTCTVAGSDGVGDATKIKPSSGKGDVKATASQNTQSLRHAINTKGTGTSGRAAADHAISTKGTGAAGRASGVELAIKTKGTSAQRTAASVDHAINTKGTGTSGRAAPGPGGDCDDGNEVAPAAASIKPPTTDMAIKCKGTGAQ